VLKVEERTERGEARRVLEASTAESWAGESGVREEEDLLEASHTEIKWLAA